MFLFQVLSILAKQLVNVRKQKAKIFVIGSKMQSLGTQQRVGGCMISLNRLFAECFCQDSDAIVRLYI